MKYKIVIAILLSLSWYIFSGVKEVSYILYGVVSIIATLLILNRIHFLESNTSLNFKFKYLSFLIFLFKEIVKSSLEVTLLIWKKKQDETALISWINCDLPNDFKKTLYANSVTLTPGTICLDIHLDKMQVHCINEEILEALEKGEFLNLIKDL